MGLKKLLTVNHVKKEYGNTKNIRIMHLKCQNGIRESIKTLFPKKQTRITQPLKGFVMRVVGWVKGFETILKIHKCR